MTEKDTEPRAVGSAAELLRDVTLDITGVTFYQVSAELRDSVSGEDPEVGTIVPTYALKTLVEGDHVGVRLHVHLEAEIGVADVDAAVAYKTPYPVSMTEAVKLEFANEVGVMALVPYLREAISTITQKVFGEAVLMPVFQRGELWFSEEEAVSE